MNTKEANIVVVTMAVSGVWWFFIGRAYEHAKLSQEGRLRY